MLQIFEAELSFLIARQRLPRKFNNNNRKEIIMSKNSNNKPQGKQNQTATPAKTPESGTITATGAVITSAIAEPAQPATPATPEGEKKKPGRPVGYRSAFRLPVSAIPPTLDQMQIPGAEVPKSAMEFAAEVMEVAKAGGDPTTVKKTKTTAGKTVAEWRKENAAQILLVPRSAVNAYLEAVGVKLFATLTEKDMGDA